MHYDPFSQTVHVLDSVHKLEGLAASLSTEVLRLNNAVAKMKFWAPGQQQQNTSGRWIAGDSLEGGA